MLDDYLPIVKATISETCTLVVAARVRSDRISIPTNEIYFFLKQYGKNAELKITFPAGVTEEISNLKVQVIYCVDFGRIYEKTSLLHASESHNYVTQKKSSQNVRYLYCEYLTGINLPRELAAFT